MNALQRYQAATTVMDLDATGLPAVAQVQCTNAIKDHYAPWTTAQSSAPPTMAYRHWADLIRSVVYGSGSSQESARHGSELDYRTLTYLKAYASAHMAHWVERGREQDPIKGYKIARQIARTELEEAAARFRVAVRLLEDDMLTELLPLLPAEVA